MTRVRRPWGSANQRSASSSLWPLLVGVGILASLFVGQAAAAPSSSDATKSFTSTQHPGGTHHSKRPSAPFKFKHFRKGLHRTSLITEVIPGPDGNMWFLDNGTIPAIGRISLKGKITEFSDGLRRPTPCKDSLNGEPSLCDEPQHIAVGSDGNMWFTYKGGLGRITPEGVITEFSAGLVEGALPGDITAGPDGNMWFTDEAHGPSIGRITPSGQITEFYSEREALERESALEQGLSIRPHPQTYYNPQPNQIASANGFIWALPFGLAKITPGGTMTLYHADPKPPPPNGSDEVGIPGLRQNNTLGAIAAGLDGNISFLDIQSPTTIGTITASGAISEFDAGPPSRAESFDTGAALATEQNGTVWFSETGGGLGRYTPGNGKRVFSKGVDVSEIAIGRDRHIWYCGDDKAGRISGKGKVTRLGTTVPCMTLAAGPHQTLWFTGPVSNGIYRTSTRPRLCPKKAPKGAICAEGPSPRA